MKMFIEVLISKVLGAYAKWLRHMSFERLYKLVRIIGEIKDWFE